MQSNQVAKGLRLCFRPKGNGVVDAALDLQHVFLCVFFCD